VALLSRTTASWCCFTGLLLPYRCGREPGSGPRLMSSSPHQHHCNTIHHSPLLHSQSGIVQYVCCNILQNTKWYALWKCGSKPAFPIRLRFTVQHADAYTVPVNPVLTIPRRPRRNLQCVVVKEQTQETTANGRLVSAIPTFLLQLVSSGSRGQGFSRNHISSANLILRLKYVMSVNN